MQRTLHLLIMISSLAATPALVKSAAPLQTNAIDLGVRSTPNYRVLYDSELDVAKGWLYYARDGQGTAKVRYKMSAPNDPALLELHSVQGSPAGLNMMVPVLTGYIECEYRVLARQEQTSFDLYAIPVKDILNGAPIEVGAERVADPRNVSSPFRVRGHVPDNQAGVEWHQLRVPFDFRKLGGVIATIVAPRVNETTDAKGRGGIQFRHFRILATVVEEVRP